MLDLVTARAEQRMTSSTLHIELPSAGNPPEK
jgi:hypothetical protein